MRAAEMSRRRDNRPMLTEAYIEALLVDEELADMVWEVWDARLISNDGATWAWLLIVISSAKHPCRRG